jgi:uncharacterized protein YndB with AHSA1/START domain
MTLREVSLRRVLPASRERVFAAWTRPELMLRWLYPAQGWATDVSTESRVGGAFRLVMREPSGVEHVQFGKWLEIEPVSRLVFTWSCPELGVTNSVVTVELVPQGEGTELSLRHELPPDPEIRREHQGGWEGCLGSLEAFLQQAQTPTKE